MVINSINNSVKRQVGTVERAWVSEKGGFNLNVPLSHYVNLEKNNNPYFIGFFHLSHKFFNRKNINVHKRSSTVLHMYFKLPCIFGELDRNH